LYFCSLVTKLFLKKKNKKRRKEHKNLIPIGEKNFLKKDIKIQMHLSTHEGLLDTNQLYSDFRKK